MASTPSVRLPPMVTRPPAQATGAADSAVMFEPTPKGVRVTKPSSRIGGMVGLNVSSRGISASARTKLATFSTGRLTPT
jgi:hypothetical protein